MLTRDKLINEIMGGRLEGSLGNLEILIRAALRQAYNRGYEAGAMKAQEQMMAGEKGNHNREFLEIIAEYHEPDACVNHEWKGKPYYSIMYKENGEGFIGYGTYNPSVLSEYIRKYFIHCEEAQEQMMEVGNGEDHRSKS